MDVEKALRKQGVDPEKIEEALDPGVHARALKEAAKQSGLNDEKIEERVSPGLHDKMAAITGNNMRKHKFSHTVVEHHKDGSHTVHHIHKKHGHEHNVPKREGDVKGAAADHDAMLDHVMDHTSQPNPGEGKNEMNEAMGAAGPAAGAPPAGA
jgi:hypothetical protein